MPGSDTRSAPPPPTPPPLGLVVPENRPRSTMALTAICISYAMIFLDITVVTVAINAIHKDFHANIAGLQWVVDGYALVFASLLLSAGAISDRFGTKATMIAGLTIFTAASGLCGIAPSLNLLLAARALQGLGAALQIPATMSMLSKIFPDEQQRIKAIVITMLTANFALAAGPMTGGLIIAWVGWRPVFLLNVPAGVATIFLARRGIPTNRPAARRKADLPAQALAIIALASLTYALIEGRHFGFASPLILTLFAITATGVALFIAVEKRAADPMAPLRLFTNRSFTISVTSGFLLNFDFYGLMFLFSIYFPIIRHYSSWQTGLAFLPMTGTLAIGNLIGGRWVGKSGPRMPTAAGMTLCAAGSFGLLIIGRHTDYWHLLPLLAFVGTGSAMTTTTIVTATLAAVEPHEAGIGTGLLNCSRQVGGVIGVAIIGALIGTGKGFIAGAHRGAVIVGAGAVLSAIMALSFFTRTTNTPAAAEVQLAALEG